MLAGAPCGDISMHPQREGSVCDFALLDLETHGWLRIGFTMLVSVLARRFGAALCARGIIEAHCVIGVRSVLGKCGGRACGGAPQCARHGQTLSDGPPALSTNVDNMSAPREAAVLFPEALTLAGSLFMNGTGNPQRGARRTPTA